MAGLGQFDGTIHDTMIGNGHGRHVFCLSLLDQIFDAGGAIEQTVFSVQMQRYERAWTHLELPEFSGRFAAPRSSGCAADKPGAITLS